ncbi:hypothetical protein A2U01_0088108, partial [Trifolium medium]|nr:hypothetical protein [Trifolium medium]
MSLSSRTSSIIVVVGGWHMISLWCLTVSGKMSWLLAAVTDSKSFWALSLHMPLLIAMKASNIA